MGLYNMVFGHHDEAPLVLLLLGEEPLFFGRFRDAWLEKLDNDELRLVVYTRNGGGNREDQEEAWGRIKRHPLYLADADDSFDSTYASAYFKLPSPIPDAILKDAPEELRNDEAIVERLRLLAREPVDTGEQWKQVINALDKRQP